MSCHVSSQESKALMVPIELACGVVAGPLFVSSFTAIGARRAGYDWRRHAVSSLADGRAGWLQLDRDWVRLAERAVATRVDLGPAVSR
jgi:hypothetical protein